MSDEGQEGLQAAQAALDAIKSDDVQAFAAALHDYVKACEAEEDEPDNSGGDDEEEQGQPAPGKKATSGISPRSWIRKSDGY